MIFLLSPAKTLDFETPLPPGLAATLPRFPDRTRELVEVLRRRSPAELSRLMHISDALARLNAGRFRDFAETPAPANARQAVLAFAGDVYDGLQARKLDRAALDWAQRHVRILSGLYGLLRPLDRIQPYRLEMGTRLSIGRARSLYDYWGPAIAEALNEDLAADATPVVVNLASQEYFHAVDLRVLKARVVECVFEDRKGNGPYKIVSFFAKKARGLMVRYAVERRARLPAQLLGFDLEGYRHDPAASGPERIVFRRTMQA